MPPSKTIGIFFQFTSLLAYSIYLFIWKFFLRISEALLKKMQKQNWEVVTARCREYMIAAVIGSEGTIRKEENSAQSRMCVIKMQKEPYY